MRGHGILAAMSRSGKAEITRGRLLKAASRVFGRRGYHDASLREIAEEAGVSKGALYYNFASKDDLFLALLDARMQERLEEIEVAFGVDDSTGAPVDRAARDYVENLKRNREWITLFFEFVAFAARDPQFGDRFAQRFKGFWAALAEVVERRARELGVDLPLPAQHLAIAIDALGIGFMIPEIVDPGGVPQELLGRTLGYLLSGVTQSHG
jgi:AcrR family transcriptional regulator